MDIVTCHPIHLDRNSDVRLKILLARGLEAGSKAPINQSPLGLVNIIYTATKPN